MILTKKELEDYTETEMFDLFHGYTPPKEDFHFIVTTTDPDKAREEQEKQQQLEEEQRKAEEERQRQEQAKAFQAEQLKKQREEELKRQEAERQKAELERQRQLAEQKRKAEEERRKREEEERQRKLKEEAERKAEEERQQKLQEEQRRQAELEHQRKLQEQQAQQNGYQQAATNVEVPQTPDPWAKLEDTPAFQAEQASLAGFIQGDTGQALRKKHNQQAPTDQTPQNTLLKPQSGSLTPGGEQVDISDVNPDITQVKTLKGSQNSQLGQMPTVEEAERTKLKDAQMRDALAVDDKPKGTMPIQRNQPRRNTGTGSSRVSYATEPTKPTQPTVNNTENTKQPTPTTVTDGTVRQTRRQEFSLEDIKKSAVMQNLLIAGQQESVKLQADIKAITVPPMRIEDLEDGSQWALNFQDENILATIFSINVGEMGDFSILFRDGRNFLAYPKSKAPADLSKIKQMGYRYLYDNYSLKNLITQLAPLCASQNEYELQGMQFLQVNFKTIILRRN